MNVHVHVYIVLVGPLCNKFELYQWENRRGHKVRTYKEYHSVCPSSELGLSQPLSRQRVFPSPQKQGGGVTLACGWGVGGVPIPTRGIHCGTLYMYVLCGRGANNKRARLMSLCVQSRKGNGRKRPDAIFCRLILLQPPHRKPAGAGFTWYVTWRKTKRKVRQISWEGGGDRINRVGAK